MKNLLGSNQYQTKQRGFQFKGYKEVFVITLILMPVMYFGHQAAVSKEGKYLSPIPDNAYASTIKPTPTPGLPELASLPMREQNMDTIKRIWGKDAYIGLAIAKAESGYRSNAIDNDSDGTQDQGVFQINSIHNIPGMFDAVANISYAYSLYLREGTTPWNSSKHNWENWL